MNALAGTPALARLALRRERTVAPWWFLLMIALALVLVAYIQRNMPTAELKAAYTGVINQNAFFRALGGGTVEPDLGVLSSWRSGGFLYVINALAALFAVIRYTRGDEDTGRMELLRAGAVGRLAPLTAALLVAGGVSAAGGVLTAAALVAIGLDPVGSAAYGAAIVAAGWVFAALGAMAAQLARTAGTARTIVLAVLGISYVLRYAGDASGQTWMRNISPIGWSHLVEPYRAERWWILGLPLAVTVVLAAAAYRLAARRDLGAGLMPERRGPASAPQLRGPVALSWRLNRRLLFAWAAGVAVFAAGAGGASTLARQLTNAPGYSLQLLLQGFGGRSGTDLDAVLWPVILIFAHVIALYPVLMVQRLRAEERSGRAEAVLATPATRLRWAAGHLVVAGLGTAALLAVAGLVFGAFFGALVGDPTTDTPRILVATVQTVPAAWLVGAVGVLAYGLVPRAAAALCWVVWAGTALLGQVAGPLYGRWGGTPFEPFHYIPNIVAGAPFDPRPALLMIALTAGLLAAGLLALRRRDIGA